MDIKNNRIIIALNLLIIFTLLSTIAFARPVADAAFDSMRGGLSQIHNFFAGRQFEPYAKAIDFFFFSFLFIAIYMMGARYAFKEIKKPEQVIVILLGLMTAFLLVLADISAVALLPFIHWLFYILLFILYWWLLKGIKNGFWRFILALLLTLLTIGLIQGLFNTLSKPQIGTISAPDTSGFSLGGFGFGNFFKDWGNNFGTIGIPQFTTPGFSGVSDWGKNILGGVETTKITGPITETTTQKETVTTTTTGGGTSGTTTPTASNWKKYWPWLLLLLLLPLLAWGGKKLWDKRKPRVRGGTELTGPDEITIQQIIDELNEIINEKYEIIKKIEEIRRQKKKATWEFCDCYAKVLRFDRSFWKDPDSGAAKQFTGQGKAVQDLLNLEIELEKQLQGLMKIENVTYYNN